MTKKLLINLDTGGDDPGRATVALLLASAALQRGNDVAVRLIREAVRLALPGYADRVACAGCPPVGRLLERYTQAGGQVLVCPSCFSARELDARALVAGARLATPAAGDKWTEDTSAAMFGSEDAH